MKKIVLTFTVMLLFLNDSWADGGTIPFTGHDIEIEIDYITYRLFTDSNTALANFPVSHRISESSFYYPKHIEVPETVEYNGESFTVKYVMNREEYTMDYVSVPQSATYLTLYSWSNPKTGGYASYIDTLHIPSLEMWFNLDHLHVPKYNHLLVGDSKEEVTDLMIPSGIGIVNGHNLDYLHLFSITIPDDVTDLGGIDMILELQHIYCYAENPPQLSNFFSAYSSSPFYDEYIGYYKDITLHVPQAYIENYKSARPWNAIANIVPLDKDVDGIGVPNCVPLLPDSAVYDLQGRRLNGKPTKGIYIQNGKKHVK